MSETVRTWDIGDSDPGVLVQLVKTTEITDDYGDPIQFGRKVDPDLWKGYDRGEKIYLSWIELVRRYGPITEVSS